MKAILYIMTAGYVLLGIFVGIWCKRIHDLLKRIELNRQKIVNLLNQERGHPHGHPSDSRKGSN